MNALEKALAKTIAKIEPDKKKIIRNAKKLKKCKKCGHWYSLQGQSGVNHNRFCTGK